MVIHNLIASQSLFKIGVISELICWIAFLILPVVLYELFRAVNETYTKLMVAFAVVQVPIAFINLLNKFAVLSLISGSAYLKVFAIDQLYAQIMLHINLYRQGNLINQIFWGLWLFPLGYLVYKSGFLPKILGVLLMAGCFGYLIDFFGSFLFLDYNKTIISDYITLPASLGEVGICLWLLILGVRNQKSAEFINLSQVS